MQPCFNIDVEPAFGLITITLSGFFYPDDAARYVSALRAAQARLQTRPNEHVTLVDMREVKIQLQDSVTLFRGTMTDPTYRSRRLALVTAGGLTKLQIQRAAEGRGASFFTSIAEASAWLLQSDPQAA